MSHPSTVSKEQHLTCTLILLSFIVILLSLVPSFIRIRDNLHYRPPHRSNENIISLGACAGNVTLPVQLEGEGLENEDRDSGLRLFYLTTTGRCGEENDKYQGQHPQKPLSAKGHVLLVHGTGVSSRIFTDGFGGIPNGHDTVWNILHERHGYDVTAIDLRGHGLSGDIAGPHDVNNLGKDLELFLEALGFEEARNHCFGHSVGFGACMSLSVHRPDLVSTLVGSGFLFDRSRFDLLAYLFSHELVVRFLGMAALGAIAHIAIKEQNPGKITDWFHDTHMDGYVNIASGWLRHNLTQYLGQHRVPTLYLFGEYDSDVGHSPEFAEIEIAKMPSGFGEIKEFPGHSHNIFGEIGGSEKVTEAAVQFIKRRGGD